MGDPSLSTSPRLRRGMSIALICLGALILVPSGLCTAFFGIRFLADITNARGLIWLVPLVGGPPIAIGLALVLWGRFLWRLRSDRKRDPTNP